MFFDWREISACLNDNGEKSTERRKIQEKEGITDEARSLRREKVRDQQYSGDINIHWNRR